MAGADETLTVEARLIDSVTPQLQKMGQNVRNGFARMGKEAQQFGGRMSKVTAGMKEGVTDFAKRFGPAAIAIAAATKAMQMLGDAVRYVNERTMEFEKTLSTVKAILRPTSGEFAALSQEARALGESTAFSASEAGSAFVELGKLGLNANQIIATSSDVLNIAAASQVDMATAAEATARTLGQYQLNAGEAGRVTDVMAKSFNISALDMTRFSESMKFAGATAGQLGMSLEQTTGALAQMASQGIVGSQAGTALRRIMLTMADESSSAAQMIAQAGKQTGTFAEKLAVLQSANLSPTQIKETFGLLSSTAAGILIEGSENVAGFTKQLENAQGTAKAFADTMLDNVAGATKILESSQEGLAIAIGDAFGPAKRKRIEFYTQVIQFATSFVKAHKEELTTLANILSGAFLWALNTVTFGFRTLLSAFEVGQGIILNTGSIIFKVIDKIGWAARKLGIDMNTSFSAGMAEGLGKEAEEAFVRSIHAIEGRKLDDAIKGQLEASKEAIKTFGESAQEDPVTSALFGSEDAMKAAAEKEKTFMSSVNALRTENMKQTHEGRLALLAEQRTQLLDQAQQFGQDTSDIEIAFQRKVTDEIQKEQDKRFKQQLALHKKESDIRKNRLADEKKNATAIADARARLTDTLISSMSRLSQHFVKNEKHQKKIALVTSIIQGALAVQRALASGPPPLSFIQAGIVGASAAANTAIIASQAFKKGGIISRPTQALMGEAGMEGVVSNRGMQNIGVGGVNALNNGQGISKNVTNQITYGPTINVTSEGAGEGITEKVVDALRDNVEVFAEFFKGDVVQRGYLEDVNV